MGYVANQIIEFVRSYLDNNKDLFKYDRTTMAKVISVGTATSVVEFNGQQHTCRMKDGISIAVGDIVIVKIPNNNKDHKYIDGKLVK